MPARQLLGGGDRLLGFEGQLVEVHRLRFRDVCGRVVEDELAAVLPVHLRRSPRASRARAARCARCMRCSSSSRRSTCSTPARLSPSSVVSRWISAQPLEVGLGVEARVPGGALRADEALLLVHAQRLRVHADELGGDGDHVARAGRPSCEAPPPFELLERARAPSCSRFFGTVDAHAREQVALAAALRASARRGPCMRSSLPSSEPAGTFSETVPSGVGTSTVAPSAASGYVTGTSTTRSAPRRSYSGERRDAGDDEEVAGRGAAVRRARPCPCSRIRVPSLTPAGIFTV